MKKPQAYRMIEAQCSMCPNETFKLCYCSYRGEYIEPITGKSASPVVGNVMAWKYVEDENV